MPTDEQNQEELAALTELLRAHHRYGTKALSVRDCLKCRTIPESIKANYKRIYHRNYPTSTRLD